jgi:ribonuclease Y
MANNVSPDDILFLEKRLLEYEKREEELLSGLQKVSGLTVEEAKKQLLAVVADKAKTEAARIIRQAVETAKIDAKEKAKEILVTEMVHGATSYVAEFTVSILKIPNDEVKGKIIGKEGKNIRALEQATGVDFILDEEGEIRISSFDGVRREVAKIALQKLIADGRIQPERIEEVVGQTRQQINKIILEEGIKLAQAVGVFNLPEETLFLLGKFKYRTSYGQNLITHTLEETKIGMALASEVGADLNTVRLGCLLHDIGKVIDKEEGSHVILGVELLRRLNFPDKVVACVEEHHEDKEFSCIESMIVYIADAISGSRPGARYEDLDNYIKHMEDLENICKNFSGVTDAWVFQAGREIRVLVDPGKVTDNDTFIMAADIRNKIEQEVKDFPGQIKVTLIRELRVTETTR